jgi:ABC-2 type transport system permease protein
MHKSVDKIWLIAKRDYIASIRTKAFLFGLVVAPLLFGGSFLGVALMKGRPDVRERRIAILDRTGVSAQAVIHAAQLANERDLIDKSSGRQTKPRYRFEAVPPDESDPAGQRLALSDRIRHGELYAFIEIHADALEPPKAATGSEATAIRDDDAIADWYANEGGIAETRRWFATPLSDALHRMRLVKLGIDPGHFDDVFRPVNLQSMNLLSRDEKTGKPRVAGKKRDIETFAVSFGVTMLLVMIVMFTAGPMLPAMAEDKMQRVFEMLLASATPFELVTGKVLAALGRSLTSAVVYIAGAILLLNSLTMIGLAPLQLLGWFLIYLITEIVMLCAFATALGAACGSPQDAQSLGIVLLAPVMVPLFLLVPVLQQPDGPMATGLSLFPLFSPLLMLMRQALPGGVPWWQPWVGLAGSLAVTIAICWIAARIFRVGILLQGKSPNIADLLRWAIRG